MEDTQPVIVPTLSRAKISSNLSYPIGAEQISAALAAAAQFPNLKLHFYSGFESGLRKGHYELLRVISEPGNAIGEMAYFNPIQTPTSISMGDCSATGPARFAP